jgi:DNA methylase
MARRTRAATGEGGQLTRKANAQPAGGGGGGWAKMNADMAANRAKRQAQTFGTNAAVGNGGMCDQVVGGRKPETASLKGELTFGTTMHPYDGGKSGEAGVTGTSIFDPVLCELAYRWFCPPGGLVLDPFAGGSVRGVVAAKCGRRYIGIDLSERQCAANRAQAEVICGGSEMPVWVCEDAANLAAGGDWAADFIFSCPPYGDLEVYSDNPADLSTMAPEAFMGAYRKIIAAAIGKLKEDRFACFVVGDYRDKLRSSRLNDPSAQTRHAAVDIGLRNSR